MKEIELALGQETTNRMRYSYSKVKLKLLSPKCQKLYIPERYKYIILSTLLRISQISCFFRAMEDEKRKTLRDQQKYNQQNEQYKDRLVRKRHDDQLCKLLGRICQNITRKTC